MPTAKPIRVLQLVTEGRSREATRLSGALREQSSSMPGAPTEPGTVTQALTAALVDVIAAMTAGDENALSLALGCADDAHRAGRPAWAAAARAVAAGMLLEAGRSSEALAMVAMAELDLAEELSGGQRLDPPDGPTGPGAAANNLGSIYTEFGLYARAEAHLTEAARVSAEEYGPDFRGQACIDRLNLLVLHFSWAIDLEADGEDVAAREQARRGLALVPGVISLAREEDWPTIVDEARVVELGCRSIAEPGSLPDDARHQVRAIIDTSPEGSLLRRSIPLLVLARLCRLAGDQPGAAQAAALASRSAYGTDDPCLMGALREAMLAVVPPGSPAIDYGHALRGRLRRHRTDLSADLDHRMAMLRLERTHAEVRAAREQLERALDAAGEQEARLQDAASHDPLTGLLNRAALQSRLARALSSEERGGALTVAFIDLDGFKQVNDRRGHVVGDQLLAAVAVGLRGAVRDTDALARYGGDEFVCVREGVREPDDLLQWADRLRRAVEEVAAAVDGDIPVTASIGLCVVSRGAAPTPTEVIGQADAAMYEAKREGPGRVRMVTVPSA